MIDNTNPFGSNSLPAVTFSHLTVQSSHLKTWRDFRPSPGLGFEVARHCHADGLHIAEPWLPGVAIGIEHQSPDEAIIAIHQNGALLVYDQACLAAPRSEIVWRTLQERKGGNQQEVRERFAPALGPQFAAFFQGSNIKPPPGPFLITSLAPGLLRHPEAALWLGNLEANLFWQLWAERQATFRAGSS